MSLALSHRTTTTQAGIDRLLVFWLPIMVLSLLVLRNDSRTAYAKLAAGGVQEYNDLALDAETGTRERPLLFLALGATGAFLLWRDHRRGGRPVYRPIPLLIGLLGAYGCCSVIWSDAPVLTTKRLIVLGCITVGGFGIGKVGSSRDFWRAIIACCSLFIAIGVAAELTYGEFLGGGGYRFSGVFHPNKQVFICAFLFLAGCCMFQIERKRIYLFIALIALAGVVLTKSRSGTAACLLAGAWLWWAYLPRAWFVSAMIAGLLACGLGLIAWGATGREVPLDSITRMGRSDELADPTQLTGRLPIWSETLAAFSAQPLLGFGYGAFWSPERIRYFESQNGWTFNHAHSIYLESAVNWGLGGLFIMAMIVVAAVRRCLYLLGTTEAMAARWTIALMILAAVSGIAESVFVADGYEAIVLCASFSLVASHGPVPPARTAR